MTPSASEKWRGLALAAFLCSWFVFFSWDGLRAHFAPDDMMNIDSFYWSPGPWRLFVSQFLLWRGYYRPMGGLFYLPIYYAAGLHPLPYHIGLSLILLANVWLVYRVARLLGCERAAAALAALCASYHAGLSNLYYNTAYVYDALCGFFYLAALAYYIGIRSRGEFLGWRRTAVFAALFVCALNSKEMALTLPAALLAYEWIFHGPPWGAAPRAAPPRGEPASPPGSPLRSVLPVPLLAALLAGADLYGKVFGVDALTGMEGYRPVFSLDRVHDFQAIFFRDAAFLHLDWLGIAMIWGVLSYLAWRPGARPALRFSWAYLLIAPLPIEFLPGKSQACLYLPAIAAAWCAAIVFVDLARAAAGFFAREPLFRHLGGPALLAAFLAAAVYYWGRTNIDRKTHDVRPVMAALGRQTWEVIEQFRALAPHVASGSHVVFLHDPFQEWDMLFIADLWFRDRSVAVHLERLTPLPSQGLARAVQFDFRDGKLLRIQ